ncbi:MAG: hypothetical protein ACHP6I_03225 [Rickettsiales bacterium]
MKYLYLPLVLLLSINSVVAKEKRSVFDKPAKKEVVKFEDEAKLTCYHYPDFMVKELDNGQKGALILSITPTSTQTKLPCEQETEGEVLVTDFAGQFEGAKGDYAFFKSAVSEDNISPFIVIDGQSGEKVFEDKQDVGHHIHAIKVLSDGFALRYRKAFNSGCSLYKGKEDCWETIVNGVEPAPISVPKCNKAYEQNLAAAEVDDKNEIADLPTIISYDVEATYNHGEVKFTALPGKASCWPAE